MIRQSHISPATLTRPVGLVGMIGAAALFAVTLILPSAYAADESTPKFRRVPTQFIAALGDPAANSGTGAEHWGVWPVDPGPRGVWLNRFVTDLEAEDGLAPAKWQFDSSDWWLDENGIIMEQPEFPLPPGKYVVTGDREAVTILTVEPSDSTGARSWKLDDDVALLDVTHLPCRSARYTSGSGAGSCSPANVAESLFPVEPGSIMPDVQGCKRQDYAVLFVIGVEVAD